MSVRGLTCNSAFAENFVLLLLISALPIEGPAVAKDLYALGMRSVQDLKGKDAEQLYQELCKMHAAHDCSCMLYTLRCSLFSCSFSLFARGSLLSCTPYCLSYLFVAVFFCSICTQLVCRVTRAI